MGASEYCLRKAEFGGHATRERGSDLGKGCSVKKLSLKTSSIVALREGSFISILDMNLLVVNDRETVSGKL